MSVTLQQLEEADGQAQEAIGGRSHMEVNGLTRHYFGEVADLLPQLFRGGASPEDVRPIVLDLCRASRETRLVADTSIPRSVTGAIQVVFNLAAQRVMELGFPEDYAEEHARVIRSDNWPHKVPRDEPATSNQEPATRNELTS